MLKIKKYKGPHTCMIPVINRNHSQLDIMYISIMTRPLVKAEVSISMPAMRSAVAKVIRHSPFLYGWLG